MSIYAEPERRPSKPRPWLRQAFRLVAVALLLAGAISCQFTAMPATRPDDFSIRLRLMGGLGGYYSEMVISAQECGSYDDAIGMEGPAVTICTIAPEDLDALYADLRAIKFDKSGVYGFSHIETCTDGIEQSIAVTANLAIYRQLEPKCRLLFGDKQRYGQVSALIQQYLDTKIHSEPANFIIQFRQFSPERIAAFLSEIDHPKGIIRATAPTSLFDAQPSLIVDINERATPEQIQSLREAILASPLVYRLLE